MMKFMEVTEKASACSRVPGVLREGLGWPLARLAHLITSLHNEALAPLELNLRTFAVLAMVGEGEARTQLEIAQTVGLDKTTLVATIDDLERRGLVERAADPNDRRARIVGITSLGRPLLERACACVRDTEARIFADMPAHESNALKSALVGLMNGTLHGSIERSGSCF